MAAAKQKKIQGKRNAYHIVKQGTYNIYDGIHDPIVSEEDWQLAQAKRQIHGHKQEKTHSLEHEHILSGLVKCPVCGAGMYGNVNRKKKPDGSFLKSISFLFPVFYDGQEVQELSYDKETTVETVCLLTHTG